MPDKPSEAFKKAEEKREAAQERAADARQVQQDKQDKADAYDKAKADAKEEKYQAGKVETEFSTKKHKYLLVDPPGLVPMGQWGIAVWSRDEGSEEWPAFLDNHGEWWWATTTAQNGINPAVEKTEAPLGWRML